MNAIKREIYINTDEVITDKVFYADINIELGKNCIIFSSDLDRDYLEYKKSEEIILIKDSNNEEILKPETVKEDYIYLRIRKFLNTVFTKNETLFIATKTKAFEKNNGNSIPTLVIENTLVLSIGDEYEITY